MEGVQKLLQAAVIALVLIVGAEAACRYARQKRSAEPLKRFKRETVTCDSTTKYRRADGKCNNLNNQDWGSAGIPFLRLLASLTYDDGYNTPKYNDTAGDPLPHPRTISNNVHFHLDFTSNRHSTMVMQWGQFLDHDITLTPQDTSETSDCCSWSDSVLTNASSPCFPIHLPLNDSYFLDNKCINLVRSAAYDDTGSDSSNPREQYNAVTAFIDGSMIYGSSDAETDALRDTSSGAGQLRVENTNFLPINSDTSKCHYDSAEPEYYCFEAGDVRVNAFFGLGAMQTVFMREHNRIAATLKAQNSTWDDEKVFQQARRIVIAELQVITFQEWLPQVLGDTAMTDYGLNTGNYAYDSSINPSLPNVFSTAAFRFGHSMLPEDFTIGGVTYGTEELFKETKYVIDDLGDVVESLIDRAGQRADAWYVDAMRNKLDETDSVTKDGADIVALNIQRGRDHGLPDYNSWREYCGMARITGFGTNEGSDFGTIQRVDLRDTYASVDDIDLYSGGISEIPVTGAAVGPLYICLIGETLQKLKNGDRLWWESTDDDTGFNTAQIEELKNVTLSKVLCDNVYDSSFQMESNVFRTGSATKPCSRYNRRNTVDLALWSNE